MSSFSNNPMTLLLLLLLLLLQLVLLMLSPFTASGYTLIELACFNSDTPHTCLRCVKSDPASAKSDLAGIAAIVVSCISRQAEALSSNMTAMASQEKDKEVKGIYLKCSKLYSDAKGILDGSAKKSMKNEEYDDAERFVVKALSLDYDCHDRCEGKGKVRGDVLEGMNKYEELSEAACRIIERLT